jgi:hypothetical protein
MIGNVIIFSPRHFTRTEGGDAGLRLLPVKEDDDEAQRPGITAPLWRSRTQNREREIGLGRRRQEERKLYFTTREISQTRGSSTVVLVCFAQGVGTYI